MLILVDMADPVEIWIEETKKKIKQIKKRKSKDRLTIVGGIAICNVAIQASTIGWNSWFQNPTIMEKFTEEELQKMFNAFREITINLLEHDIKWTKDLMKKTKKGKKKKEKDLMYIRGTRDKKPSAKAPYIA